MSDLRAPGHVPLKLKPGEVIELHGKLWGRCSGCDKLVRIDKPIFGSLHWCVP